MDLKKHASISVTITPVLARATVAFLDPSTNVESAWADLRAEILAHPSLAGQTITSEKVDGSIAPARGITATITFAAPKPVAPAPKTPSPVMPPVAPAVLPA